MLVAEIIKLLDAGFTKEEIQKMQEKTPEESKPEPTPAEAGQDPAPADQKSKEKNPVAEPVNAQMLKEIQDLKKAVYAMNIMNTEQPQPSSVDDILAKALKEG